MPEKFQTVVFPLKKHQMFSVHTTPEEFEIATITVIVVLCLNKTRSEGSHVIIVIFRKASFLVTFVFVKESFKT